MISFSGRGILLDIEGTVSSLHYVRDVLFPYARLHLPVALRNLWNDEGMQRIRDELAALNGSPDFETWTGGVGMPPEKRLKQMHVALLKLMDQDAKVGPLKEIQGLIWREGFRTGALRSHVYPEVFRILKDWKVLRKDMRIYSSGSIEAQKQFFMHVDAGPSNTIDLSHYFTAFYDTTTGPKKEAASYTRIIAAYRLPSSQILFLSDIEAELDAARTAGMKTALVCRPDHPCSESSHPIVQTFDDIIVT